MESTNQILNKLIDEFDVSEEFKDFCKLNNYKIFKNVTEIPVSELMEKPGMTHKIIIEFYGVLKRYGLEGELKEI